MDEDKRLITIDSYKPTDNSQSETVSKPKKFSKIKSILLFIIIIIILSAITILYVYFTPTTYVIIDVNASINLKVNRWNKIIDVSSLDINGTKLMMGTKLKYKNINDGLILILSTAEENNYITPLSTDKIDNELSIFISGNNIDTSSFSNIARDRKFDFQINENGSSSN